MAKQKTGGLGADAIFGNEQPPTEPKSEEQPKPKASAKPSRAESIRTTVMLPLGVVVLLSRMKEQSILDGNRQSQGDIIAESIRTLAKIRDIEV